MHPSGIDNIPQHAANGLRRPDFAQRSILVIEIVGSSERTIAFMDDEIKNLLDDGAFDLINGEIVKRAVLFADTTIVCQLVAEGTCAAPPDMLPS